MKSARYYELLEKAKSLPIYPHLSKIVEASSASATSVVIIQSEPASGKSTQIPRALFEAAAASKEKRNHLNRIAVTQPRRVAAISVARRVADELDCVCGELVGYSVRYSDCSSSATAVKYLTDGMLIQGAMHNSGGGLFFDGFSTVVIDEAHERSVNTDVVLGLAKRTLLLQQHYPDSTPRCRFVIMSATMDTSLFQNFFHISDTLTPVTIFVPGRVFPVERRYLSSSGGDDGGKNQSRRDDDSSALEAGARAVELCRRVVSDIHRSGQPGDILVFLHGSAHINRLVNLLRGDFAFTSSATTQSASAAEAEADGDDDDSDIYSYFAGCRKTDGVSDADENQKQQPQEPAVIVLPLYASLSLEQQQKVFDPVPAGVRKIVVSTNIAETSLTIDGIVYVVDSLLVKEHAYSANRLSNSLTTRWTSRASAEQRAGRAGRTRPGVVFRLVTEAQYRSPRMFAEQAEPEISRSSLIDVVLTLLRVGCENIVSFPFPTVPGAAALSGALQSLLALGAIDPETAALTPDGAMMSGLPCDACSARMMIFGQRSGCGVEAAALAALLQGAIFSRSGEAGSGRGASSSTSSSKFLSAGESDHVLLLKIFEQWIVLKQQQSDGVLEEKVRRQFCFDNFLSYSALAEAERAFHQLVTALKNAMNVTALSSCGLSSADSSAKVRRAVFSGYFMNTAWRRGVTGTTFAQQKQQQQQSLWLPVAAQSLDIAPPSSVSTVVSSSPAISHQHQQLRQDATIIHTSLASRTQSKWVVFHSLVEQEEVAVYSDRLATSNAGNSRPQHSRQRLILRTVSPIDESWLSDLDPGAAGFFDPTEVLDSSLARELHRLTRPADHDFGKLF